MVVWWCRPLPNGSPESPERREPLLFPSPNPPKTISPLRQNELRDDTARLLRTHTRLGVTRRVKEAPLPNITGTKRVCFSQPVRKASVRSICHHDPLLIAQRASVCLLSADLPHPHQRELPVSSLTSKSVCFTFIQNQAKVWAHFTVSNDGRDALDGVHRHIYSKLIYKTNI